ncbi:MAG: IS200/IS605 family element transposase accessory protein TnpB [Symploca sp. SIO2B6]|nr:IS200/IS605 family element transposase accessory protein TnpB [Symploca sp. SIO2B6]
MKDLNQKRDNRVSNYLHTASRRVINWCIGNEISTLVIGNNQGWKQGINIGKRNNQQFTNVPHTKLIEMLTYKGRLAGIRVVITEESYTSKARALDGDSVPKHKPDTIALRARLQGRRLQGRRGEFDKVLAI